MNNEDKPVCKCCGEIIEENVAVYYNDQWFCISCEEFAWEEIKEEFLERTIVN